MKKYILLSLLGLFFLAQQPVHAVVSVTKTTQATTANEVATSSVKAWKDMSRKEKRAHKKAVKKQLKSAIKEAKQANDTNLLLLVIIAILLPPLAMGIYDGLSNRFWLSLLLTILFYLPGLIYTLVVILGEK